MGSQRSFSLLNLDPPLYPIKKKAVGLTAASPAQLLRRHAPSLPPRAPRGARCREGGSSSIGCFRRKRPEAAPRRRRPAAAGAPAGKREEGRVSGPRPRSRSQGRQRIKRQEEEREAPPRRRRRRAPAPPSPAPQEGRGRKGHPAAEEAPPGPRRPPPRPPPRASPPGVDPSQAP